MVNIYLRSISAILLIMGLYQVAGASSSDDQMADISAGQKRAAVCMSCHGADGISKIPGTPHLAGQQLAYLKRAIHAYREGITRQDPIMNSMARPLTDADIANIASYFSSLKR